LINHHEDQEAHEGAKIPFFAAFVLRGEIHHIGHATRESEGILIYMKG
jgi:hypothetical protein